VTNTKEETISNLNKFTTPHHPKTQISKLRLPKKVVVQSTTTNSCFSSPPCLHSSLPSSYPKKIYAFGAAAFLGAAFFAAGFFAGVAFFTILARKNEIRTFAAGFFATLAPAVFGFVAFFAAGWTLAMSHLRGMRDLGSFGFGGFGSSWFGCGGGSGCSGFRRSFWFGCSLGFGSGFRLGNLLWCSSLLCSGFLCSGLLLPEISPEQEKRVVGGGEYGCGFLFSCDFLCQFQGARVSCCGGEYTGIQSSLDCCFELEATSAITSP
jgi:hypothetical protein